MTVTAQSLSSVTWASPMGPSPPAASGWPRRDATIRSVNMSWLTREGPVNSPATAASARRSQRVRSGPVRYANRVCTGLHQMVSGSSAGSPPVFWQAVRARACALPRYGGHGLSSRTGSSAMSLTASQSNWNTTVPSARSPARLSASSAIVFLVGDAWYL